MSDLLHDLISLASVTAFVAGMAILMGALA